MGSTPWAKRPSSPSDRSRQSDRSMKEILLMGSGYLPLFARFQKHPNATVVSRIFGFPNNFPFQTPKKRTVGQPGFFGTRWSESVTDGSVSTSNRRLGRAANLPPRGRSVMFCFDTSMWFSFFECRVLGGIFSGEAKKGHHLFRWKHAKVAPGKEKKQQNTQRR